MVDFGPLDADALRALLEAAKLGKSLFDDGTKQHEDREEDTDSPDPKETDTEDQPSGASTSDVNNPTIGPGGIIGNVTVNNLYFDTTGRKLDMSQATCCYDYPDGRCPHRRQ